MIYNAAKVRRLSTIFQVDTCKTKKDKNSSVVQLSQAIIYNVGRVRNFPTKLQVDTCKGKEDISAQVQLHTL